MRFVMARSRPEITTGARKGQLGYIGLGSNAETPLGEPQGRFGTEREREG